MNASTNENSVVVMLQSEQVRQSEFSPISECGDSYIVGNCEVLARHIIYPDHSDGTKLLHEAIPSQDLSERGWSVNRINYTPLDVVLGIINVQVAKKIERQPLGACEFVTGEIRSVDFQGNNGERVLAVIDDGKSDNPGHTHIFCTRKFSRPEIKLIKDAIIRVMGEVKRLETVFSNMTNEKND